jgi:peptide/nickel transport system permease protein
MILYLARRLFAALPVVFLTSVIVFLLMRLLPGDPVALLLAQAQTEISAETVQGLRAQHGLDMPVYEQYFAWAARSLSGDFGRSILSRQPVWDVLAPRILPTVQIGLSAWFLAMLVAVPLGAITAREPGSWKDWLGTIGALVGAAMPYFLVGGLLIWLVALQWGLLPASGYVPLHEDVWGSIRSTILPVLTLSLGLAAVIARQARASFSDVLRFAYITTARAKGLPESRVMTRHAFRNAMLPVVTILGIQLGTLFSGAVVTETIFAVPGVGRLLVDSILSRDYPVVQAVVLFITMAVVLSNLLVDIAYGLLDPRTRERRA